MMNHRNPLIIIALLTGSLASAQVAPKYSNEFLSIGVGARALGMSNAYVSTVNDVTSGYWNPAGLLSVTNDYQVGLMHSEYFAGIAKYDYMGVAKPIDSNSVGAFSIIRFGVDNIPNTTELIDANGNVDYDRITTFSAADYAFLFSYARRLKIEGLRVGGNFKIIRRKVGDFGGAWGFGLDAGLQYDHKKWHLGAMVRDVTSTFNAWSYNLTDEVKSTFLLTGNEIPENSLELTLPRLITGVSRLWSKEEKKFSYRAELDLDWTFDGKRNVLISTSALSVDPHLGLEVGYKGLVYLRAGIGNIQTTTDVAGADVTTFQPNMGLGVKIKALTIDYALTDIGDQSVALYSNVFSLRFDINQKPK